jgi:hypothetical protein
MMLDYHPVAYRSDSLGSGLDHDEALVTAYREPAKVIAYREAETHPDPKGAWGRRGHGGLPPNCTTPSRGVGPFSNPRSLD